MGNLSENFDLIEFFVNEPPCNIEEMAPKLWPRIRKNLVNAFLQPLRDYLNEPIIVTSGYRNSSRNRLIGGKPHSHHLFEADRSAVDFYTENMTEAWSWLKDHPQSFAYAYWNTGDNYIHVSGITKTDKRTGVTWIVGPPVNSDVYPTKNQKR